MFFCIKFNNPARQGTVLRLLFFVRIAQTPCGFLPVPGSKNCYARIRLDLRGPGHSQNLPDEDFAQ